MKRVVIGLLVAALLGIGVYFVWQRTANMDRPSDEVGSGQSGEPSGEAQESDTEGSQEEGTNEEPETETE